MTSTLRRCWFFFAGLLIFIPNNPGSPAKTPLFLTAA
jgi:hypothetical protein